MKRMYKMFIILICIMSFMCGCSVTGITFEKATEGPTPSPDPTAEWPEGCLLVINDTEVDYREVLLYLLAAKEEAELLYGEGIWDYTLDETGVTYGDLRREQVLEEVIDLKLVCSYADNMAVRVYEEDTADSAEYTAEFIENVGTANLLQYSITEAIIKQLYLDNITAMKVYEAITLSVDTNISNDEARQVVLQYIQRKKLKEDEDGTTVAMSEEERLAARTKAQELRDTAMTKENFLNYAEMNTEGTEGAEMTAGYGDLPAEAEKIVFSLAGGELSPVIETEDWFYIFKCISSFDEDATNMKKEEIIQKRQDAAFRETFLNWKAGASIQKNDRLWAEMEY